MCIKKIEILTDGLGMHRRAIGSGDRYVGEYLPGKQPPADVMGPCSPVGPLFVPIILSGEYMVSQRSKSLTMSQAFVPNQFHNTLVLYITTIVN